MQLFPPALSAVLTAVWAFNFSEWDSPLIAVPSIVAFPQPVHKIIAPGQMLIDNSAVRFLLFLPHGRTKLLGELGVPDGECNELYHISLHLWPDTPTGSHYL